MFYVTLIFGACVPALYVAACCYFTAMYISDKYLLLAFHQKSRDFNHDFHMNVIQRASRLGYMFHIVFSFLALVVWVIQLNSFYEEEEKLNILAVLLIYAACLYCSSAVYSIYRFVKEYKYFSKSNKVEEDVKLKHKLCSFMLSCCR